MAKNPNERIGTHRSRANRRLPRLTLLAFLLGGAILALCYPARAQDLRWETVSGTVVRADTGQPLADVEVSFREVAATTHTDALGHFSLTGLSPGRYTLEAHLHGFSGQATSIEVAAGIDREPVALALEPLARFLSEVVVTPSRYTLYEKNPEMRTSLSRDDVRRMPHFGEDPFRAVRWIPGTSGEDLSSQINVRGGEVNETLVQLDGLEIQDGFHLKELFSMLSIVDAETIDGLEFISGGFPVTYGNRMSGVIDMVSSNAGPPRTTIGLSTTNLGALSEGRFSGGRGHWLVSARRTDLDKVIEWVDPDNGLEPSFYDGFAKISYLLGGHTSISLDLLGSRDTTHYTDWTENGEVDEEMSASSSNSYVWINIKTAWSPRLLSQTVLSLGRVEQEREGLITYWHQEGNVDDARSFDIAGMRQDWSLGFGDRHIVMWGFDVRRQEASYDYQSFSIVRDPLFAGGEGPHITERNFDIDPRGSSYGVYLADRWRLAESLVAEIGGRWDRQTYTGQDDQLSPRATLYWDLGDHTKLRAAWGVYQQAQAINELQLADGIATFWPAQRAEHQLVSLEHDLSRYLNLRVELYHKRLTDVQPHFENLFNPIEIFPEIEADRVEVAPERSRADGIEIMLRHNRGRRWSYWLSYAYARAEDDIDGVWVPRSWDQRHSATFSVNVRPSTRWDLNLSGAYHTGWPTTGMTGEIVYDANGAAYLVPHIEARNGERLPHYLRLDFRGSRYFRLKNGAVSLFLEITNLLNRENLGRPEGFSFRNTAGHLDIEVDWEAFMPMIPSLGLRWTF